MPAELAVETVRVARGEGPAAQTLQVGVGHDGFDEPLAETVGAVVFVDEDIAQVGKDGVVADDAGETDLPVAVVETEDQRMVEGAFGAFARTSRCPVGAGEESGDGVTVEAGGVGADGEVVPVDFGHLRHGVSVS